MTLYEYVNYALGAIILLVVVLRVVALIFSFIVDVFARWLK